MLVSGLVVDLDDVDDDVDGEVPAPARGVFTPCRDCGGPSLVVDADDRCESCSDRWRRRPGPPLLWPEHLWPEYLREPSAKEPRPAARTKGAPRPDRRCKECGRDLPFRAGKGAQRQRCPTCAVVQRNRRQRTADAKKRARKGRPEPAALCTCLNCGCRFRRRSRSGPAPRRCDVCRGAKKAADRAASENRRRRRSQ